MCGCRDLNVRDQKKEVKREGRKVQDLWVRCLGDRQVKASIKKLSAEAMFGKKVGLFGGAFYPAKSFPTSFSKYEITTYTCLCITLRKTLAPMSWSM
jgi:hypothetical protein